MDLMEKEERDGTALPPTPTKQRTAKISLFRAILLMLRRNSVKKPPIHQEILDSSTLNIVSGIRPLHHLTPTPLLPPPAPPAGIEFQFHDVPLPPQSEADDDGMSRYASAEDLRSLDNSEEEEGQGSAIDARAEEFIAKFYEQMKIQRLNSVNENNEIEQS